MKAGPIEIGRLLQNKQRFCVPIYQRHYVWNRAKQWEPFWNDIRTKAIECLAGRERRFSHFMGAVVLETRGGFSAGRVPAFQVVDGQQRLTTFQIFLSAARDYARDAGFESSEERIVSYLLNDKPHLMEDPEVEIYKVWPTQYDRELFIDILSGDRGSLREKYGEYFYAKRDKIYAYSTVPRLLSAYGFFYDHIKFAVETDDLDDEFAPVVEDTAEEEPEQLEGAIAPDEIRFDAIWQALVEEFKVVEIILEDGDDAQVIFETLNERGEPLLAADLVRNNIFHRADAAGINADKLFDTHWKPFEHSFWSFEEKQGRYKKPRIEFFLANFIAGKIAGDVNLTKLFSEYKAFLKPKGKSTTPPFSSVTSEVEELKRFGAIYRELIERQTDSALAHFSKRLLPWDVTTVYPLVLRIWASDMDEVEKAECLDLLLSMIVRRSVSGLTNKNYNKFFLAVVSHLDDNDWSLQTMSRFLLQQSSDTGRFPLDDEFERKWVTSPAYTQLKSARTRAVLEEIELAKRTTYHETQSLAPGLTVEHILPQTWQKSWPLEDGTLPTEHESFMALHAALEDDTRQGQIVKRNRMKETFGNLTLLTAPLNSSVSNGAFTDKREALAEHSLLVLNREIVGHESWDENDITERGAALFQLARDIWKAPNPNA